VIPDTIDREGTTPMKAITLALCLTGLPGLAVAQAACPTGADLERGIRITFADGGTEIFRAAGPGLITVTGEEPDGTGFLMDLGQGVNLIYWEATESGRGTGDYLSYDYNGLAPADMPVPRPGGKGWQSDVTVTTPDGSRSEPQRYIYGPMSTVGIGDCQYDMMEIEITYETSDNYHEMVRYLPELGLSYLVWNEADGMPRVPIEATAIVRAGK
jgi:hypothetical protein